MFPFGQAVRRLLVVLPALPVIALCTSCNGFFVSENSIETMAVSPTALILKAATSSASGDSYTLSASGTTVGGTTSDVTSASTWKTSDSTIATVSSGDVTIITTAANATATITATDGGQSATCAVLTYTGTEPTAISLKFPSTVTTTSVAVGATFKMTATAALSGNSAYDISDYVSWSSSSTSIATVDAYGNITTVAAGTFTITATATFASDSVTETSTSFTVI
jgi:uncharacterized protein YjdB